MGTFVLILPNSGTFVNIFSHDTFHKRVYYSMYYFCFYYAFSLFPRRGIKISNQKDGSKCSHLNFSRLCSFDTIPAFAYSARLLDFFLPIIKNIPNPTTTTAQPSNKIHIFVRTTPLSDALGDSVPFITESVSTMV